MRTPLSRPSASQPSPAPIRRTGINYGPFQQFMVDNADRFLQDIPAPPALKAKGIPTASNGPIPTKNWTAAAAEWNRLYDSTYATIEVRPEDLADLSEVVFDSSNSTPTLRDLTASLNQKPPEQTFYMLLPPKGSTTPLKQIAVDTFRPNTQKLRDLLQEVANDPLGNALLSELQRNSGWIIGVDPDKVEKETIIKDGKKYPIGGYTNFLEKRIVLRSDTNIQTLGHELTHAVAGINSNSHQEEGLAALIGHQLAKNLYNNQNNQEALDNLAEDKTAFQQIFQERLEYLERNPENTSARRELRNFKEKAKDIHHRYFNVFDTCLQQNRPPRECLIQSNESLQGSPWITAKDRQKIEEYLKELRDVEDFITSDSPETQKKVFTEGLDNSRGYPPYEGLPDRSDIRFTLRRLGIIG